MLALRINWSPRVLFVAVGAIVAFPFVCPSCVTAAIYWLLYGFVWIKGSLAAPSVYQPLEGVTRIHVSLYKNTWSGTDVADPAKIRQLVTATNSQRATMPWEPFVGIHSNCTIRLTFYAESTKVGTLGINGAAFYTEDSVERHRGAAEEELKRFRSLLPVSELPTSCASLK